MIRMADISKTFGQGTPNQVEAIHRIDLSVQEGDFLTVIGSNGAGKSTLLNLVAGTYGPTSGSIFVRDVDVTRQPEFKRARFIGRIFQNPLLGTASNMSLEDNMMIACKKGFKGLRISLNRKMRELFRERLRALDMGLENRLKENVGLLSGGQRQALTLLMMVLSKPTLILLDEHTAALDPKNAQLVLDLTMRFIKEHDLTTIMVTHNMSHAIQYGNRLLMMDKGEVILEAKDDAKSDLTVDKLVAKFHEIRRRTFETDEILLSENE